MWENQLCETFNGKQSLGEAHACETDVASSDLGTSSMPRHSPAATPHEPSSAPTARKGVCTQKQAAARHAGLFPQECWGRWIGALAGRVEQQRENGTKAVVRGRLCLKQASEVA